ncbi:unnamed protein product [Pylaiella littoralis]
MRWSLVGFGAAADDVAGNIRRVKDPGWFAAVVVGSIISMLPPTILQPKSNE